MADSPVIYALTAMRAELSGLILDLERQATRHKAELVHLDATLRLFDPDAVPALIRPKRKAHPSAVFATGELSGFIRGTIRQEALVSSRDLAVRMMERKSMNPEDRKTRREGMLYLTYRASRCRFRVIGETPMAQPIFTAAHFQTEEGAFAFVEAKLWPKGPVCPHCGSVERIKKLAGKTTRTGLHKCYACMKPFTVRHNTVFESSHLGLHLWLQAIHLMCSNKKGISSHQISQTLGVTVKTAWFLTHRIREAMKEVRDLFTEPMGGAGKIVDADETYIGRKSASSAFKPPVEKVAVVALVERDGRVRSFHVPRVTGANVYPILSRHVARESRLMTDESSVYNGIGWNFAQHDTVVHSKAEYVRGDVSTNTIEGYFSVLKRGLTGIYQHVSEAHLHRYLAEFDFRYSNRIKLGVDDLARADRALQGVVGKRLTYRTARGGRPAQARSA